MSTIFFSENSLLKLFASFLKKNHIICLIIEFWKFFIYYGYKYFIKYVIHKYFHPVYGLSSILLRDKTLDFKAFGILFNRGKLPLWLS